MHHIFVYYLIEKLDIDNCILHPKMRNYEDGVGNQILEEAHLYVVNATCESIL